MELSINNVTKQFKDKKAVNDISFSMGNGVYGLLGVNGAGKTTLMRMLCTLTTPDCGTITWDGKDIFKMGASYRQILGYLPQDFGADEEPARRDQLEGFGKALDHVKVAVQRQKGQQRDHPEKKGRDARLIAGERIGEVDHGKAHLKAQQLPTGLYGHEQKIDGHAQDQAHDRFTQNHDHNIKRVRGHMVSRQRQMRPYAQREHQGYGGLDLHGNIVGGKHRQHEHDDAYAHHGQYEAQHLCLVIVEHVHAEGFAKWLPKKTACWGRRASEG